MELEKNIKIKGKLTLDDYALFNKFLMKKVYIKVFTVSFILFLVLIGLLHKEKAQWDFVLLMSLFFSVVVGLFVFLETKIKLKKAFKSQAFSELVKYELNYTINENGVEVKSEKGATLYTWKDIIKVNEFNNILFLHVSKENAILIPKKFFIDKNNIEDLKQIIQKNSIEYRTNTNFNI